MLRKTDGFKASIMKYGEGVSYKAGAVEYLMPKACAEKLLAERKGLEKNMRPQDYLVKYVNEECGLLYQCVKVTLT